MPELSSLVEPSPTTDRSGGGSPLFAWLRRHESVLAKAAVILLVLVCVGVYLWIWTIPRRSSEHATYVLGRTDFVSGSSAAVRVLVRNVSSEKPMPGVRVDVSLQSRTSGKAKQLYTGRTDVYGTTDARFRVPEDMPDENELVVHTRAETGSDWATQVVRVVPSLKLLLTTDKPIYQPGQVIHIRALLLGALELKPMAGQTLDLVIEDARGNKVLRQTLKTSAYGIASADFQLASEVNQGDYKITVEHPKARAEKTIGVLWYVLPKFKVALTTDKPFYLLSDAVLGKVQADYFFGKPVAQGEVTVIAEVQSAGRQQIAEIRGKTDDQGAFEFRVDIPSKVAGVAQEGELGTLFLEATVIDEASHSESGARELPIASGALVIDAVPESGQLHRGLENMIYIMTSYPNGAPAPTTIEVEHGDKLDELTAGEYGVAEWRVKPERDDLFFTVVAREASGWMAKKEFRLGAGSETEQVLLRPDRPIYRVGETMHLVHVSLSRPMVIRSVVCLDRSI